MDFTTNYCGPYWSDGRFQSSVAKGKNAPVSQLDAECQAHDAAYATAKEEQDLVDADEQFYEKTKDLGLRGKLYGSTVLHVNRLTRFGKHALVDPMLSLFGIGPKVAPKQQQAPLGTGPKKLSKVRIKPEPPVIKDEPPDAGLIVTAPKVTDTGDCCPAEDMPLAGKTVGAWQDATFVHPTAGRTNDSTEYGAIDSDNRVYGFHDYIPPYKPLRKKKRKTMTARQEIEAAKVFFAEHPPSTKHYKKCPECRALMQLPKYQLLLSQLGTPSAGRKLP